MRGRYWTTDEEILAMDAYVSGGKARSSDPVFRELCELLGRPFDVVKMRFSNYKNLEDPDKGLTGGSKTPKLRKVWNEYSDDPDRLSATASTIKQHLEANQNPGGSRDTELTGLITEAPEGETLTRSHIFRERNRELVQKKKKSFLQETGRLVCEACGFDFAERYGERGEDFIECHHVKALRDLKPGNTTRLDDLVLLCSNCHSMVHARQPWLEMKDLMRLIQRGARRRRARRSTPKRRQE